MMEAGEKKEEGIAGIKATNRWRALRRREIRSLRSPRDKPNQR
jgi:hypothetical protein